MFQAEIQRRLAAFSIIQDLQFTRCLQPAFQSGAQPGVIFDNDQVHHFT
jgi:hypothetical protein